MRKEINGKNPSNCKRRRIVISLMGSTAVAYLAVTGLATNLALAGRGMVRTLRRAARGELADAGKEALKPLSAPAVLTQAASAGLVLEVLAAVQDVARLSSQTAPSRKSSQAAAAHWSSITTLSKTDPAASLAESDVCWPFVEGRGRCAASFAWHRLVPLL
jgi:hypothetical protein